MQPTLIYPPLSSSELGSNFNVVIAYEDFEAGKHAKQTCDFLTDNLGSDCHVNTQMWKFDVLSIPKLREMAAHDAALADIVVISSLGAPLPDEVKAWIEVWLSEKNHPLALVALFERAEQAPLETWAARSYLESVAQRANLAGAHQELGQVTPAQGPLVGQPTQLAVINGHAALP